MGKACLNKEVGSYECEGERDTYSFFTSLSDIQDSSSNEEQCGVGSILSEDSFTFEGSDVSIRLFSLDLNALNENENGSKNPVKFTIPPKIEQRKEARQREKRLRRVALLPENSRNYLVESSMDSSREYSQPFFDWRHEMVEHGEESVKPCGCHKSRKAKCFKELEMENIEKGDIKKSLFYRDIIEWCRDYEVNKTREVCVPSIHEFYLHGNGSDNLF
ncbi:CBM_collapsed_G0002300.mRNA.1.CDS.1 [Saccharomyces cerevisiae]|nr:CBM_collapsed_G0002300.mRNA.1.CDS.1 [Saccharomyces cerevisiae]